MTELTRQAILDGLAEEQSALLALLSCFSDEEWHTLTRNDGWTVHDIVAHIADVHLSTAATSGVAPGVSKVNVGVTLPMMPDGRVNQERLNMLRFEANRQLSRDQVVGRLAKAFKAVAKAVSAPDDRRLAGPGPYGSPETMLEWFNAAVLHNREHRLQLERLYTRATQ
jgi:hypothetical protein